MLKIFKYRDRDDLVQVEVIPAGRNGRFVWKATTPLDYVAGSPPFDSGSEGLQMTPPPRKRVRALCPFPGFATRQEAWDDAISLLNVVGE